jgi:type I restriction enzyme S subunit
MASDATVEIVWDEFPLSELTSANVTYGVVQPGTQVSYGVPMIRVNNFSGNTLNLGDVMRISHDVERKYERTRIHTGDVLITVVGSVGQVAIVPPELTGWNIARAVALIRPRSPALARWIAHFLRSPIAQHRMGIAANTTVQTTVNLKDLRAMSIPMPPEPVRRKISELLSALDDRIDLLRQTNTTLEAIAQALFKSWFVDFDPVRAKAEGREPEAMDAATAALFPNEVETSELGLIPQGWSTGPFGNQFDFTMGQSPPGSTYNSDRIGVPFFQGCTDFGEVFPVERIFCSAPTRFARAGDVLMSVRAPVGALNIATFECSIGRGLCSVRHISGSTGLTHLSLKACVARIENAAGEGALFRSLSKQQLAGLPVLVPSELVTSKFIANIEPIIDRMIVAAQQASNVSDLRDTLLPRLISGKLRLPEAEAAIESALDA